jgi:hypothetical protein
VSVRIERPGGSVLPVANDHVYGDEPPIAIRGIWTGPTETVPKSGPTVIESIDVAVAPHAKTTMLSRKRLTKRLMFTEHPHEDEIAVSGNTRSLPVPSIAKISREL